MKRRKIRKKKLTGLTIAFAICDLIAIICFIVVYSPLTDFKNIFVTTAMTTRSHQYLAYVFYSKEMVDGIMSNNYITTIDEDVNTDDIIIDTSEKKEYKDEYEKELFTREPGNDAYKVINLKVGKANGYLVAIYKPEKVVLIRTAKFNVGGWGVRVVDLCKRYNATVCINGGGFANGLDKGSDIPIGYVIDDGEILWPKNDDNLRQEIIGITEDGKLKLMNNATGTEALEAGIKYAVHFGPSLIINGKTAEIKGTPYGVANKCAIAQRKDGLMMFLVTEGETYADGASLKDVVATLEKYGAYNAANLDGGQSTSLVVNNKLINSPNYLAKQIGGRYVVTGFGLLK